MIYLGIDCGATTSKVGAVDASGSPLSNRLRQSETRGEAGPRAMLDGWMEATRGFLHDHGKTWAEVGGVGLAIPGPYRSYGVLGEQPNLPASLDGWRFLDDLAQAVARAAGRDIPVATANDGQLAGLAEADPIQKEASGSVLMLAPGSGLGCSFVDAGGDLLRGDHQAAVILAHQPAPHTRLGLPAFRCGCGRDWGCFEAYCSISGLPQLLDELLPDFPGHDLADDSADSKEKALSLRDRAQNEDPLALAVFDRQAQALGYAVAAGAMAYDPTHVVVGGGLMDPDATTPRFRQRYLNGVRSAAAEYAWVDLGELTLREARFGELSQAVGAALLILSDSADGGTGADSRA